ncbi:hypothetical protein [Streptomyces mirabilis]|uniref:hypothetical protein n=1 Tax=Streptomyces mirabilis TaxID=68239 RepID=UPI0036BC90C9
MPAPTLSSGQDNATAQPSGEQVYGRLPHLLHGGLPQPSRKLRKVGRYPTS